MKTINFVADIDNALQKMLQSAPAKDSIKLRGPFIPVLWNKDNPEQNISIAARRFSGDDDSDDISLEYQFFFLDGACNILSGASDTAAMREELTGIINDALETFEDNVSPERDIPKYRETKTLENGQVEFVFDVHEHKPDESES